MSAIATTVAMSPTGSIEGLSEAEAARRYGAGAGNKVQGRAGRSYAY